MEEIKEEQKPPTPKNSIKHNKIAVPEMTVEYLKRHPSLHATTKPGGGGGGKFNCLCSPTTHPGSFRCRYHRLQGLTRAGGSVGSNLSLLAAAKQTTITISDSLQAQ